MSVFAMSISVLAVDPSPMPTPNIPGLPNEQLALYYIWLTLKAWGIDITVGEVSEYTDDVSAWLEQQVYDYLASLPSQTSFPQWVQPWMWGSDYWGFIQGNSSFLEDCQDFAEYLVIQFSLINNDVYTDYVNKVIVNGEEYPIYTINYRTTYNYRWYVTGATTTDEGLPITNDSYYYLATGYIAHLFFVPSNSNWYFDILDADYNRVYTNGIAWSGTANDEFELQFYHNIYSAYSDRPYALLKVNGVNSGSDQGPAYFTTNEFYEYFMTGLSIKTTIIALPDDDPNYTQGDSIVIVDGEPTYVVVQWPESVSVANLPAIITQQSIPDIGNDTENPGFSVPWQAINGLIQYVTIPAGAIISLVNEAPVEGVIMLYALIGGIIIFGMIRIMREH